MFARLFKNLHFLTGCLKSFLKSYKYLLVSLILYGLCWLFSYSPTYDVTIEKLGSANSVRSITLPFLEKSEPRTSLNGNYYRVKGKIILPYSSLADRLVLQTDDCPVSFRVNGKSVNLIDVPPLQMGCNFKNHLFAIDLKQSNLHAGANDFEIIFNDLGGFYGVVLQTKSVLLKKSLIFVVPLIFIWLFMHFAGITRREFFSIHTLAAALLLAAGVFAISLSYSKLSPTYDEPIHIGAGMEWWDKGSYTIEALHPPLSRIAGAALLYLDGIVPSPALYRNSEYAFVGLGNYLLGKDGRYIRNLTLARMGILPFYILAGCVVFIWSNRLFGNRAALLSLLLYVLSPMIAGHAGLATTDFPYATMFITAIFAFTIWLEKPGGYNSIFLGLATALMVTAKFSSLVQFPAAVLLIMLWHFFYSRKRAGNHEAKASAYFINAIFFALPCFILLLLSVYYFDGFHSLIEGLREVHDKNKYGHAVWLFHRLNNHGVWYYFPVGFFFKNPLPFLIFIVMGIVFSCKMLKANSNHPVFFPVLAAIGILIPSMLGDINIGIRHILPVFPLMAIIGGYGLFKMLESRKFFFSARVLAIILVIWQVVSFARISPDYFTYFNEFAGPNPENVLIDTDLDWGQDLFRLQDAVKQYGIKEISVCYFGTAEINKLVEARILPCVLGNTSYKGWVAASHYRRKLDPSMSWLNNHSFTRVGRSINLYYID